ncbi:MAG: hypothetical protein ACRDY3_01495 [Acidimicrobiales bacterium]
MGGLPTGDGQEPVGTGAGASSATGTAWEEILDRLERRLADWRAALRGEGEFPSAFEWPAGLGDCPARLRARARLVLATQRDIEDEMTARRAALGALLHGIGTSERRPPVPLFVDQRA